MIKVILRSARLTIQVWSWENWWWKERTECHMTLWHTHAHHKINVKHIVLTFKMVMKRIDLHLIFWVNKITMATFESKTNIFLKVMFMKFLFHGIMWYFLVQWNLGIFKFYKASWENTLVQIFFSFNKVSKHLGHWKFWIDIYF